MKTITALSLVAALMVLVAGCATDKPPKKDRDAFKTDQPVWE